ncbi:hypothetical protein ACWKSP_05370 [Micromonosporaceae bacterium Da 78-11]
MADLTDDISSIWHPLPVEAADPELVDAAIRDEVLADRARVASQLQRAWDEVGADPLLAALAAAHRRRAADEAVIRQLIAYGREFVRPRPYVLAELAKAAGLSASGARTAYDHHDIDAVVAATGARAREWRAPDQEGGTLTLDYLIDYLRRRNRRPDRVDSLIELLTGAGWSARLPESRNPGVRSTRRYIRWEKIWPSGLKISLYQHPSSVGTGNVGVDDPRYFFTTYADETVEETARKLERFVEGAVAAMTTTKSKPRRRNRDGAEADRGLRG